MKKLLLILPVIFIPTLTHADVYKCLVNGKTIYQNVSCQAKQEEAIVKLTGDAKPQHKILSPQNTSIAIERDAHGHIKRSESAKNDFKDSHPCPANGRRFGPCPGYVIDHIKALACGGADDPGNMQWQSIEAGKAKDKWERVGCSSNSVKGKTDYLPMPVHRSVDDSYFKPRYATGRHNVIYKGARGGRYTLTPSGHKLYFPRK